MSQSGPDIINLSPRGNSAKQVKMSVACELMKNQLKASPVPANDNIAVVEDAAGSPLLFTIGTSGRFDLIKSDPGAPSGMVVVDLLSGLTNGGIPAAFAVAQDHDGKITVAVAVSRTGSPGTDIYVASRLDHDTSKTAWDRFAELCFKLSGVDPGFAAVRIALGGGDDGNPASIFVAGKLNDEVMYYQALDVTLGAARWELPERATTERDIDMALGYAFGDRGLFFLYPVGESQTLECTTIVPAGERPLTFDFSPGNQHIASTFPGLKYNCVETALGSETDPERLSSDVYIGANSGVYVALGGRVSGGNFQKVTDRIQNVRQLFIREDDGNISIWAVASPNQIYYIYGRKGAPRVWNDPVLFCNSAVHIAPIRSRRRQTNELFLVDQELNVRHYWQDPGSTLWQERLLKLGSASNGVVDFVSYTTHIHMADESGVGIPNQMLHVTASEWTFVAANGLVYSLDTDTPAHIPTDVMGNVTIIYMASDISCPTLHIRSEFFDKTIHVYPNAKVQAGLQSLRSASDLRSARGRDGRPVYEGSDDDATLDAVAGNVSQLSRSAGEFASRNGYTFVSVESPGLLKHPPGGLMAALPDNFAAGMTLQSGAWVPMSAAEVRTQMLAAGDASDIIRLVAGDGLHWLMSTFSQGIRAFQEGFIVLKDGVSFFLRKIGDGLQFVLNIAGKILDIALQTLTAVFKALNWVLKLIGIDLAKLLRWLGDLIGWTDVLETSDKLIEGFDYALRFLESHVDDMKRTANDMISRVQQMISGSTDPFGQAGGSHARGGGDSILQSPVANWSLYQLSHANLFGDLNLSIDGSTALQIEQALSVLDGTAVFPAASAVQHMVEALVEGARNFSIADILGNVIKILEAAAIETVKVVVNAALGLAKVIIDLLRRLCHTRVNIPILSSVVELFLDGREMTLVRALTILMAIPLRIIYRITTGSSLDNSKIRFPPVLRAAAAGSDGPAVMLGVGAANLTVPGWTQAVYQVARIFETTGSAIRTFTYVASGTPETIWWEEVFSVIALGMMIYNVSTVGGRDEAYTMLYIVAAGFAVKLALAAAVAKKPDWLLATKWIKFVTACLPFGGISYQYVNSARARSDDLRLSSAVFFYAHKLVASFPVNAGPAVAAGVVVASLVFSATHIGLVEARSRTDAADQRAYYLL